MVIENQTKCNIYIDCKVTEPGIRRYVTEHIFNTVDIHSDIGSAVITTEYYQRIFLTYGKMFLIESNELDSNGHKIIVVKEK